MAVLARRALDFSSADIADMVREASLISIRTNMRQLPIEIYLRPMTVLSSFKERYYLKRKEKIWTAYHEAGHAIIAYLTHPTMMSSRLRSFHVRALWALVGHRRKKYAQT